MTAEERAQHLREVTELGQAFANLGWTRRLPALREYFAAVAAGGTSTSAFSPAQVTWLRRVLGLTADALPIASRCPRCPPPAKGTWNGARTTLHLEDRWVMECSTCGAQWVVLERRG